MFVIVQACRPSLYRHVGSIVQLNWTASFRAVVRVRSHHSTYAYIGDSTVLGGGGWRVRAGEEGPGRLITLPLAGN